MTKLYYLEDFSILERPATVVEVVDRADKKAIIVDETIFYPQGGGQPYDTGIITSPNAEFKVSEVRFEDGIVYHIGEYKNSENAFSKGQQVELHVDPERRLLNSKLHSAGHLVDMALVNLGIGWVPGKGFHFPEGPYVEYAGSLEGLDLEKLKTDIENECNRLIQEGQETKVVFIEKDQMHTICKFVPDYIPEGKPARVVLFNDYGVPCGGTHVHNTKEIGTMVIRKIKSKKGVIQVKYDLGN
ncbi:MAG: alanine--tRNA ligase-related protein [Candidatus Andersenbacteria bacterium]